MAGRALRTYSTNVGRYSTYNTAAKSRIWGQHEPHSQPQQKLRSKNLIMQHGSVLPHCSLSIQNRLLLPIHRLHYSRYSTPCSLRSEKPAIPTLNVLRNHDAEPFVDSGPAGNFTSLHVQYLSSRLPDQ